MSEANRDLPLSHELLSRLADTLGVRRQILDAVGTKAAQRVFQGSENASVAKRQEVIEALVRAAWVEHGPLDRAVDDELCAGLAAALGAVAHRWDERLNRTASAGFLPTPEQHATDLFFRLMAVDLGVRIGSAVYMRLLRAQAVEMITAARDGRSMRVALDETKVELGDQRSDAALAEAVGVSKNRFSEWMTGDGHPSEDNLLRLSTVLVEGHEGTPWEKVHRRLNAALLAGRFFDALATLTSKERARDLLGGLSFVGQCTSKMLAKAWAGKNDMVPAAQQLAFGGSDAESVRLVRMVADLLADQVLAGDIVGVRADWPLRVSWWQRMLDTDFLDGSALLPFEGGEIKFTDPARAAELMTQLDEETMMRVRAQELMSQGRYDDAVPVLATLVGLAPTNAEYHYNLAIGISRRPVVTDEQWGWALHECEVAAQLDPTYVEPVLQAGVILIGMDDERAKQKLLKAWEMRPSGSAGYHLGLVHHHELTLEVAIEWYERAIEVDPHYTDAMTNAADAARLLGKKRLAVYYATQAARNGDPQALNYINSPR